MGIIEKIAMSAWDHSRVFSAYEKGLLPWSKLPKENQEFILSEVKLILRVGPALKDAIAWLTEQRWQEWNKRELDFCGFIFFASVKTAGKLLL